MCKFCECNEQINTTVGNFQLKIYISEEYKNILNIRISRGLLNMTRPIRIKHCMFCGKKLI